MTIGDPRVCMHVGPCTHACFSHYPRAAKFFEMYFGGSTYEPSTKQGWQCPVCDAVWAPSHVGCNNCVGKK